MKLWYLFKQLRAADKITLFYQLIMIFLMLFNYKKIELPYLWLLFHVSVIFILFLITKKKPKGWLKYFAFWNPLVFIPINFSELHYLVHPIRPQDFDNLLIQIDFWLLGVHPTVWLEQFTFPWLTEYFQIIYTTFYFLPVILIVLLKRKNHIKTDYIIFAIVFGIYLSYLGYFLVPALGPRFTLDHLQTFALQGVWLTKSIQHLLNTLENIQRDAFPSGHTAITLVTMFYAFKYHRTYFYGLSVVGTSLVISTVYLRYHYVADVIAGVLLAAFVVSVGKYLYGKLDFNHGKDAGV